MTLPPLRHPVSYWLILIVNDGSYNGWDVWHLGRVASVSAMGYPSLKAPAQFETRAHAEEFFTRNREIIDRRCASKAGFQGYRILEEQSYWPVKYDTPLCLRMVGKRGKGVHSAHSQ